MRLGDTKSHLSERSKSSRDPARDSRLALLLPFLDQSLFLSRFSLGVSGRDVSALIVLDDRPHVLDAADRQRLEEGNERHQLFSGAIALAQPRLETDAVLGLQLEVSGVGVEDDGTFQRAAKV